MSSHVTIFHVLAKMFNLYAAHRLLEDYGIGHVNKNMHEHDYLLIKRDSDLTVRLSKTVINETHELGCLRGYYKNNWLTIKRKEGLSPYGKFVALFSFTQILLKFYINRGDLSTAALLAFMFAEYSSDIRLTQTSQFGSIISVAVGGLLVLGFIKLLRS